MSKIIDAINQENLKETVPQFSVGDTVKVMVKVVEGDRERLQGFEGIVIAKKHGGLSETFTVRRLSFGVGVEKTFQQKKVMIFSVFCTNCRGTLTICS